MFFLSLTFLCLLQIWLRGCRLSSLLDFSSWDVREGQENAATIYRRKIQACQVSFIIDLGFLFKLKVSETIYLYLPESR